jgi:hypothetical protein
MQSRDGWQPEQPGGAASADEGQPYGQPFDPSVSSPRQQPPPPGWEQGTWTQHGGTPAADNGGRTRMLIAVAVLVLIAIAAVVAVLAA